MTRFLLMGFLSLFGFTALAGTGGPAEWRVVPNSEVCMVTDVHFGRPQIPVEQAGKTYYGCCQNCKATLQTQASARTAKDPVTQKPVDKATATIAANGRGEVLYFEGKATFDQYVKAKAGGGKTK